MLLSLLTSIFVILLQFEPLHRRLHFLGEPVKLAGGRAGMHAVGFGFLGNLQKLMNLLEQIGGRGVLLVGGLRDAPRVVDRIVNHFQHHA